MSLNSSAAGTSNSSMKTSGAPSSDALFDQLLKDPQVRRRLALGKHYDALTLSEEEERAIKEDLILAKKYENELNERVTRNIENEELKKLLMQNDEESKGSTDAKMKAYYNKLQQLQIQAEAKLKKQIKDAEEYEIAKLEEDQKRLLESETKKLLEGRQLFQLSEEKQREKEQSEIEKREKWMAKDDVINDVPTSSPKRRDLVSLLQSTASQKRVILLMTVDIGDGRSDTITVKEDDSYLDLAKKFQEKHNLIPAIIEPLAEHIKFNVEKVLKERTMDMFKMAQSTHGSSMYNRSPALSKPHDTKVDKYDSLQQLDQKTKNKSSTPVSSKNSKPVHERLHESAKYKEARILRIKMELTKNELEKVMETKVPMSETSRKIVEEIERSRAKDKFQNYGEFLYNEGKAMIRKQQLEKERVQRLEDAKMEVFTFKPQINTNFKIERPNNAYMNTFKHNVMMYAEEEERKCPFKPKINQKSALMAVQKKNEEFLSDTGTTDPFESLFKDAEKRRAKLEQKQSEVVRQQLMPSTGAAKPSQEHIERLVNSRKEAEKNIMQLRMQLNSNFDAETGRELFKPITTSKRPKSAGHARQTSSVFEDLYNKTFETAKNAIAKEYYKEVDKLANTKHVNEASRKIAETAKVKKIFKLFTYLDSNNDGYLNIETDILGSSEDRFQIIDKHLQEILLDVFEQFEIDSNIGFEEFAAAVLQRMEKSDAKAMLLSSTKGPVQKVSGIDSPIIQSSPESDDGECSFRPKTNRKSDELVWARRSTGQDLFEILYKEKDTKEQNLSRLKQAYSEDEMRECSFKPHTTNPTVSGFSENTIQRLYSRSPKKKKHSYPSLEERELEECTFWPKVNNQTPERFLKSVEGRPTPTNIKTNKSYSELFMSSEAIPSNGTLKKTRSITPPSTRHVTTKTLSPTKASQSRNTRASLSLLR
ncbi:hypothetical protein C9374_002365 [Naegleria lovaniensis]|uniref:EF-hand domain-containing protein n=1 Tax=Naegleria lovaniensis TaxID=51637 RepID=A0AA88KML2_NAELO|nr:uncharacterized protein C9374_002365 [Naegleria lovaniensis]KAG2386621.1 hypothetical protein C9374_002365 [Naegleria lovaniensis]